MLVLKYWKFGVSHEPFFPGFEAGGPNIPSNIDPWTIIGDESSLIVSTDRSSCFERNKIALRIDVLCDSEGPNSCPPEGVGVYNPGYWGMVSTFYYILHMYSCILFGLYSLFVLLIEISVFFLYL